MTETAKLVVAVDSTQVKQAEEDLRSLATASAKTEKQVDQLGDQLQETAGKAAGLGKAAKPVADGVAKVGSASGKAAPHLADFSEAAKRAGLTTGQYNQAMRLLPMQLTDVVTSLSSGMPLWMVAIQQGGQIRDSFGGIGAAARGVISAVSPMAAAVSAAAVGVIGLGAAYIAGSNEAVRFNEALILTGGYARLTAGDLAGMAQQMDALSGVTKGSASAALTQVAATGQFAGEQILLVATAAEQMRDATGKAVEDTIAEFLKLGKGPVDAILELNDKQHFLTQAQLESIRTLKDQGREQEAVTEAMRVYAQVIADRTAELVPNLGLIEEAWEAIKNAARDAVDAALDIGRAAAPQQRINDLLAERYRLQANENRILMSASQKKAVQERVAAINAEIKAIQDKRVEEIKAANAPSKTVDSDAERARNQAQEQFDRIALSNLDKKARLEKEIADIRELGLKAGKSQAEIDSQIAAAQQRYAESLPKARKAPKERAYTDDAGTRTLQQLRQQEASLRSQLGTSDKLTGAQRAQAEFAQQIADLKSKVILTADQKSLLANQDAITAQLAKNAAIETEIQKRQELAKLQERGAQIEQTIAQRLASQREQNNAEIDGYGLGARERERIAAERDLRSKADQDMADLNEATPKSLIGSAEYMAEVIKIQDGLNAAINENADAWARSEAAMGDWSRGASEAFANYMTEAQNIAGQTEQIVGSAMESLTQGIGDSFAQAIVYGDDLRASLQGVAQTIMAELISSIIQMGVRWAINATLGQAMATAATASQVAMAQALLAAWTPVATAVSLATGGTNSVGAIAGIGATQAAMMATQVGGGAAGFATGGYVAGPGTGTSDDIPAWLSNGEFVTREAVVSQPGAKSFLESFNARGMAAVDDYARRVRHATGGLAGVPAPALPSPSMGSSQLAEPAKALSATLKNTVNLHVHDDPIRITQAAFNSRQGEEDFVGMLSRDPAKFRSVLGL